MKEGWSQLLKKMHYRRASSQGFGFLRNQNGEGWTEVQSLAVHIFVQTLDLDELATILLEDELAIPRIH